MISRIQLDKLFTAKFITLPNQVGEFDIPLELSHETSLVSGIKKLIADLMSWVQQQHIQDIHTNAYLEVFLNKFEKYDKNKCNHSLFHDGAINFAKILFLIKQNKIPLDYRKNVIKNLLPGLAVCEPGININITNAYLKLLFDLPSRLLAIRREIASQCALQVISENNQPILAKYNYNSHLAMQDERYILPGNEIHWENALLNLHTTELGLNSIDDAFAVQHLSDDIINSFRNSVNLNLTLEAVVDYIIQDSGFLTEFLQKNPQDHAEFIVTDDDNKNKVDNKNKIRAEDIDNFKDWINLYGRDDDFSVLALIYDDEKDKYRWIDGVKYYISFSIYKRLFNEGYCNGCSAENTNGSVYLFGKINNLSLAHIIFDSKTLPFVPYFLTLLRTHQDHLVLDNLFDKLSTNMQIELRAGLIHSINYEWLEMTDSENIIVINKWIENLYVVLTKYNALRAHVVNTKINPNELIIDLLAMVAREKRFKLKNDLCIDINADHIISYSQLTQYLKIFKPEKWLELADKLIVAHYQDSATGIATLIIKLYEDNPENLHYIRTLVTKENIVFDYHEEFGVNDYLRYLNIYKKLYPDYEADISPIYLGKIIARVAINERTNYINKLPQEYIKNVLADPNIFSYLDQLRKSDHIYNLSIFGCERLKQSFDSSPGLIIAWLHYEEVLKPNKIDKNKYFEFLYKIDKKYVCDDNLKLILNNTKPSSFEEIIDCIHHIDKNLLQSAKFTCEDLILIAKNNYDRQHPKVFHNFMDKLGKEHVKTIFNNYKNIDELCYYHGINISFFLSINHAKIFIQDLGQLVDYLNACGDKKQEYLARFDRIYIGELHAKANKYVHHLFDKHLGVKMEELITTLSHLTHYLNSFDLILRKNKLLSFDFKWIRTIIISAGMTDIINFVIIFGEQYKFLHQFLIDAKLKEFESNLFRKIALIIDVFKSDDAVNVFIRNGINFKMLLQDVDGTIKHNLLQHIITNANARDIMKLITYLGNSVSLQEEFLSALTIKKGNPWFIAFVNYIKSLSDYEKNEIIIQCQFKWIKDFYILERFIDSFSHQLKYQVFNIIDTSSDKLSDSKLFQLYHGNNKRPTMQQLYHYLAYLKSNLGEVIYGEEIYDEYINSRYVLRITDAINNSLILYLKPFSKYVRFQALKLLGTAILSCYLGDPVTALNIFTAFRDEDHAVKINQDDLPDFIKLLKHINCFSHQHILLILKATNKINFTIVFRTIYRIDNAYLQNLPINLDDFIEITKDKDSCDAFIFISLLDKNFVNKVLNIDKCGVKGERQFNAATSGNRYSFFRASEQAQDQRIIVSNRNLDVNM